MSQPYSPCRKEPPRPEIASAWKIYRLSGDEGARNALILHYMPLVRFAAVRIARRRPGQTEVEDLLQFGVFGLRDAIASFDPERNVKFETYCSLRVRGAMLDGLKAQNWIPRDVRKRLQRFNEAHEQLTMESGASPDDAAVIGKLGITREDHSRLLFDSRACSVSSLDTPSGDMSSTEREVSRAQLLRDHREPSPADSVQREDLKNLFTRELSHNERLVLTLYYYEEMTMREIGTVLGISGTRVSQMHSEIILRLRERLQSRVSEAGGIRCLNSTF